MTTTTTIADKPKLSKKNPLISGCLDLGIAKPDDYDRVAKELGREEVKLVVLMEDRQPDFFLKYDAYDAESYVRLNRHGPHNTTYYPTQSDLKLFVKAFHEVGIEIQYGFWVHENRWTNKRHPELLLTDSTGSCLCSEYYTNDFNPLASMKEDFDYGIKDGEPFAEYVCKQYSNLADDFGFDGLFLADGGMGFRLFGDDGIGVNCYDYSNSSIIRFAASQHFHDTHDHDCLLSKEKIEEKLPKEKSTSWTINNNSERMRTNDFSNDIWSYHQEQWIKWNCAEWSNFYKTIANYLHTNRNEKLGAFSCMNYGPEQAFMHGVDYNAIVESGLDYLVFQTYDYAWGTYFKLAKKDTMTNLQELVSLNEHLLASSTRSKVKILFTAETSDSIENWQCPMAKTLEDTRVYSQSLAKAKLGNSDNNTLHNNSGRIIEYKEYADNNMLTTPITDGLFIVWINDTPIDQISQIKLNFENK